MNSKVNNKGFHFRYVADKDGFTIYEKRRVSTLPSGKESERSEGYIARAFFYKESHHRNGTLIPGRSVQKSIDVSLNGPGLNKARKRVFKAVELASQHRPKVARTGCPNYRSGWNSW